MEAKRFAFGTFLFDVERGMLLDRGMPVAVGSKGLAILQCLVEARGEIVAKAALLDAVWPGLAIEESNLSVQIAQLRKRIGISHTGEEWITTVPRVGYRFGGLVQIVDREASEGTIELSATGAARSAIAVLPFNNLSSDPEQGYFAQGLSEDLITDLSRVPGLLVIARNSSFAYMGRPVDIRQIGRELGVRYVIEGSVRRAAGRVRINAEIIDAVEHTHVWADRFDRDLSDIFALQDEIVGQVVAALSGILPSSARPAIRRTGNIEAYDLFTRGRWLATQSPEDNRESQPLLERSIELDPDFAEAYAWLAVSLAFGWLYWGEPKEHYTRGIAVARQAVALDPDNSTAHSILGCLITFAGNVSEAEAELRTALRINPNDADALTFLAELRVSQGRSEEAIDTVRTALGLNPFPPGRYFWYLGYAQYAAGRYEDAVQTLSMRATRRTGSQRILAAALAQLGRMEEARMEARQFLSANPHFRIQHWADTQHFEREADRQAFVEGYLKAGLPP